MQGENQKDAAKAAQRKEERTTLANQNALVTDTFQRKQNLAQGLGGGQTSPMGNQASQSGAILTSTTESKNSLLG